MKGIGTFSEASVVALLLIVYMMWADPVPLDRNLERLVPDYMKQTGPVSVD